MEQLHNLTQGAKLQMNNFVFSSRVGFLLKCFINLLSLLILFLIGLGILSFITLPLKLTKLPKTLTGPPPPLVARVEWLCMQTQSQQSHLLYSSLNLSKALSELKFKLGRFRTKFKFFYLSKRSHKMN